MIRIFCAYPGLLMQQFPELKRLHRERRIAIASFDAHRGYIMPDDQVVMISPRAVMHTQVIRPSHLHDYSCLGSYAHSHCKHVAYILSFPLHAPCSTTGVTP